MRWTFELAADLPLILWMGFLLEQVLVNLLDNAARYTPPKTTIIIVRRRWMANGFG